MVPSLLTQGYRLIAIAFDVWALAGLLADKLKDSRADAAEAAKNSKAG